MKTFVNLLRLNNQQNPIYIATSAASDTINNTSDDWTFFSRIFGRRHNSITSRKRNGLYLIPLYSGIASLGHLTLAVIHKQQQSCSGWIIDSLEGDSSTSSQANIIKNCFSSSRINFSWHPCAVTPQT